MLVLGSRGLGGVQRNLLPLLGLGSVSDYCGAPHEDHLHCPACGESMLHGATQCCPRTWILRECAHWHFQFLSHPMACLLCSIMLRQ